MTLILGAFGPDLGPLRQALARKPVTVAGRGFESVEDGRHTQFLIQSGASGSRHLASTSLHRDSFRDGHVVFVDGAICDSADGFGAEAEHASCTLVDRPAEEISRRVRLRGRKIVDEIHGAFAAAIYAEGEGTLTLCRDPVGVKPLYYALRPFSRVAVAFSTSLRALASLPLRDRSLSIDGVASFLTNGFVMEPLTMLASAHALLPGHSISIDLGASVVDTTVSRMRKIRSGSFTGKAVAPEKAIRASLTESVSRQLPARSNCGLLLSGGVDSSTVASVITKDLQKPVDTFSLVFEDEALSESRYSRAVATRLGSSHHEVLLQEKAFTGALDDALDSLDQPTTDAINAFYISRECKRAGFDFCLAGIGSDELFGGHDCFQKVPKALRGLSLYQRLPAVLRRAFRATAPKLLSVDPHYMPSAGLRGKMISLLDQDASVLPVYLLSKRVLLPELVVRLVPGASAKDVFGIPRGLEAHISSIPEESDDLNERLSGYERFFYLGNQLLRDLEGVSSSLQLPFGLPFVDQSLIEAVTRMTPEVRFRGPLPKQLLIDSVIDILPTEAYQRPKQGFVLPIAQWVEGELRSRIDALTEDTDFVESVGLDAAVLRAFCRDCRAAGTDIFYTRLWSVFILLDWCKRAGLSAAS